MALEQIYLLNVEVFKLKQILFKNFFSFLHLELFNHRNVVEVFFEVLLVDNIKARIIASQILQDTKVR